MPTYFERRYQDCTYDEALSCMLSIIFTDDVLHEALNNCLTSAVSLADFCNVSPSLLQLSFLKNVPMAVPKYVLE